MRDRLFILYNCYHITNVFFNKYVSKAILRRFRLLILHYKFIKLAYCFDITDKVTANDVVFVKGNQCVKKGIEGSFGETHKCFQVNIGKTTKCFVCSIVVSLYETFFTFYFLIYFNFKYMLISNYVIK
jgi:hypothetical protein